jgi:hypothetical protein
VNSITAADWVSNCVATYDAARGTAQLSCEIMERLVEMHEMKFGSASLLCARLSTLADVSPSMFLTTIRLGSGDVHAVRQSFAEMAEGTGRTRQALHYEWSQEVAKVRMVFPELAQLMADYRQSTDEPERGDSEEGR